MYIKKIFLLSFFITTIVFSQEKEKVDVNTDIDLVKVYKQVIKEGYATPKIYLQLANETYFRSDYKESKIWFEKLFHEIKVTDPTLIFRYNQSLKALGLYKKEIVEVPTIGTN